MIKTIEETRLIIRVSLEVDLQIKAPEADEFTVDEVRIRFYPNGTSETLALSVGDGGVAYLLTLEPVTGRTTVGPYDEAVLRAYLGQ